VDNKTTTTQDSGETAAAVNAENVTVESGTSLYLVYQACLCVPFSFSPNFPDSALAKQQQEPLVGVDQQQQPDASIAPATVTASRSSANASSPPSHVTNYILWALLFLLLALLLRRLVENHLATSEGFEAASDDDTGVLGMRDSETA